LRQGTRTGLAAALLAAACQTAHPLAEPVPEASSSVDPLCAVAPMTPVLAAVPELEVLPAAIDPALSLADAAPGPEAERLWIDAVLQRRAPRLGTRARAAVALEIASAADRHGLDPLVVLAIIAHESHFNPRARGPRGGTGLMQLRGFVARDVAQRHNLPWRGEQTLLDPAQNVAIGTAYLAEIHRQFGDLELALAGYNMGPYRLHRVLASGGAPRGQYLGRVLTHYADLAGLAAAIETGTTACAEVDC
jgi:soluble lytic murein transglycosylase-like protein